MVSGRTVSNLTNAAGLVTGNAKATLTAESGGLPVVFGLNPESVSVQKRNTTEGKRGVVKHSFEDALKGTSNIRWKLTNAHLFGVLTKSSVDRLIGWATPAPIDAVAAYHLGSYSAAAAIKSFADEAIASKTANAVSGGDAPPETKGPEVTGSTPVFFRLPVLLFSWGLSGPAGRNLPVTLEYVSVKYKRFDDYGIPVWATVEVDLVEYVVGKPRTNPTSGGVPGRTRHVVTQGENVVQIATRAYGSPNAWRAVTEANRIDDPLRVRPGRRLAIPPAGDIQETR
ncbi:LysM peptidoglycan-binding domain-containing protein [Actinophytocola sp. NPDC049390]|uniref:LysM peptidoglycan-binding domain-containing protein n=1 Tax=Actinophytocola sp. NPDC049390 TaxID=3363894 RepID=UPI003798B51C